MMLNEEYLPDPPSVRPDANGRDDLVKGEEELEEQDEVLPYPDEIPKGTDLCSAVRIALDQIQQGVRSARSMTLQQVLGMLVGVCLVIVGNSGQLFAVNEWLSLFSNGGTPWITALTITATSTTIFFTLCFIVWCIIKRPNVRWMLTKECALLSLLIGFGNAGNGVLILSATPHTPEILQAFLFSTTIFWTFILMKIAIKDDRSYASPLVIISFLISMGGIVVGAASQFTGSTITKNQRYWILIFECGMIMVAIYNVFVFKFMTKYAHHTQEVEVRGARVVLSHSRSSISSSSIERASRRTKKTEPSSEEWERSITLKLAMLCATGISQTFWMWCFVPLDAVPWFGTSKGLKQTYDHLALGYECVFVGTGCNNSNGLYGFLFCFFYVLNYFGTAYLNGYSAAVTSMVTQLSSPMAALALLIVPRWNVSDQPINVGESIAAILLLVLGSLIYTAWEESTKATKEKIVRSLRSHGSYSEV